MKFSIVVLLLVSAFVATTLADDYLWGEIGPNDQLLARDRVWKPFVVGLVVTSKYTFKQKNNLNAATITAIQVTDDRWRSGATATLSSGGPGSKGATIKFRSQRSSGINSIVRIYGH